MEKLVTIRNLGPEQAMRAYPLAREAMGDVSPESWREMVNKLACEHSDRELSGGVIVAERNGFPRGLFTYETVHSDQTKQQLKVENLVVMEFVRRVDGASVLFDHMAELASTFGCSEVHVKLPPVSAWIKNHWDELARPQLNVSFCHSD